MSASVIQTSFSAGEISKNLFGRVDLDKYHLGLATLRNWFVDYRGGASTRPGTQFIQRCKWNHLPVRLIPFVVSTLQSYVLEFGETYIRVLANGVPIMQPTRAIVSINAAIIATVNVPAHGLVNNQQVMPQGLGGDFANLNGFLYWVEVMDADNFRLKDATNQYVNTFGFTGASVGTIAQPYEIQSPYSNTELSMLKFIQSADTMTITHPSHTPYNLIRTSGSTFQLNPVVIAPTIAQPASLSGNPTVAGNLMFGYTVTGVSANGEQSLPATTIEVMSTPLDQYGNPTASPAVQPKNIALHWTLNPAIDHYNIFKWGPVAAGSPAGTTFGQIGTSTNASFADTNIAPDYSKTPPTFRNPFFAGNPTCVAYFQQRRVYGGITPVQLDFSQTSNYNNFDVSPNVLDSDAISISIASREVNTIKALVPMSSGLVVLTSGGAFQVSGGSGGAAITPTTATALPQASTGANDMPPIVVNYDILFVQAKGSLVRDLAYNFYLQTYYGFDRSALSNHLFFNRKLLEWAYAEEPFKIIWCIRDDGALLSLTYVPEQEVYGWARHDTAGVFESVCSVPEGDEDAVYFVVRRKCQGVQVRMIERFASRKFTRVEDTWSVDCGGRTVLPRPAANINFFTNDGGLTFSIVADANVFVAGDVGTKVIWLDCGGKLEVTGYTSPTVISVTATQTLGNVIPNADPIDWNQVNSGGWEYGTKVTKIYGLSHLATKKVRVLADGMATTATVSAAGTITLAQPASKVLVGLGFQAQLQTLALDIAGQMVQGKMKRIPAATIRVDNSRALKVGPDFATLYLMKEQPAANFTPPIPLQSGDERIVIAGGWNNYGQLCVQQDEPFPASVLAIMPEVQPGDTQG